MFVDLLKTNNCVDCDWLCTVLAEELRIDSRLVTIFKSMYTSATA